MKHKRGFTLIELLAVIVILAIILAIAIPGVSRIIASSKKSALASSIAMLGRAIERDAISSKATQYTLSAGGVITQNGETLNYSGKVEPKTGSVLITINDKGQAIISGGQICDTEKKICTNGSGLKISEITSSKIGSSSEVVQIYSGNVGKNVAGNVTCKYYSDGSIVVDATGDGVMADGPFLLNYAMTIEEPYIIIDITPGSDQEQWANMMISFMALGASNFEEAAQLLVRYENAPYDQSLQAVIYMAQYLFGPDAASVYTSIYNQMVWPTSLRLNSGLTTIGNEAFTFLKLTSVTIPNGVTTIGTDAFAVNYLTDIVIPDSVTTIGSYAFSENLLMTATIGSGVTTIDQYAFENNQFTSVTIRGNSEHLVTRFNASWENIGFTPASQPS